MWVSKKTSAPPFSEYDLSFLDDYYDMYDFVPNDDLRKILAAFHTNLNNWITVINSDIRTTYDEDGVLAVRVARLLQMRNIKNRVG